MAKEPVYILLLITLVPDPKPPRTTMYTKIKLSLHENTKPVQNDSGHREVRKNYIQISFLQREVKVVQRGYKTAVICDQSPVSLESSAQKKKHSTVTRLC